MMLYSKVSPSFFLRFYTSCPLHQIIFGVILRGSPAERRQACTVKMADCPAAVRRAFTAAREINLSLALHLLVVTLDLGCHNLSD